jgi:hypothetical protein
VVDINCGIESMWISYDQKERVKNVGFNLFVCLNIKLETTTTVFNFFILIFRNEIPLIHNVRR